VAALCESVDGATSSSACIRIKRASGAMHVKWYYPTDLPLEQWQYRLERTDELTILDLSAGIRLYARVACINNASTLDNLTWAEVSPGSCSRKRRCCNESPAVSA
jgi:hypothetical protein